MSIQKISDLPRQIRRMSRRIAIAAMISILVACGNGSPTSSVSGIRNLISNAEFLLVDPPSLSELFAVLRFLTAVSSGVLNDPDALSRALFDGVRDSIADAEPRVGSAVDLVFAQAVDQLTRDSWFRVLSDPLNGIVASEVFDPALADSLATFSCAQHDTHVGSKTDAFFQSFWPLLIARVTGSGFARDFASDQADELSEVARAMFLRNADFGLSLLDAFPTATQSEAALLLATSPFRFNSAVSGTAANALSFVRSALVLDGGYQGLSRRDGSGSDDPVRLHLNRCNDQVWGQLQLLDANGAVDAQWRLRGSVDGAGQVTLNSLTELERFFTSSESLLCRDLSVVLNQVGTNLSGSWNSSAFTCPLGGSLTLDAESP